MLIAVTSLIKEELKYYNLNIKNFSFDVKTQHGHMAMLKQTEEEQNFFQHHK